MKYQMFNYKSFFFFAAAVFLTGVSAFIVPDQGSNGVANAQEVFTNESIQGTYAFTATVGAKKAAGVGVLIADGTGNFTGSEIFNVPIPIRKRQVLAFTLDGIYTVSANGMGNATFTSPNPDGTISEFSGDFVITQAEVQDFSNIKLAIEISFILREPVLGELETLLVKRLPD